MSSSEKPLSNTHPRYWAKRVFHPKVNGRETPGFCVRLQHDGQRHALTLRANTREAAGVEARDVFRRLKANGWEDVLREYEPPSGTKRLLPTGCDTRKNRDFIARPTVGDLIVAARELLNVRGRTFQFYEISIRTIVAQIFRLHAQKKYAKGKEARKWRDRVDRVPLDRIKPSDVMAWRNRRLREHDGDPQKKRSAIVTVNTAMRGAKSLYGKKIRSFLTERMNLPDPMPFDGVHPEKMPSLRYQSRIDAGQILGAARDELARQQPEQYKILLLALICGLRKSEIDGLLWEAFDFDRRVVLIAHTHAHELKSEDSAGEIDLDEQTLAVFQEFYAARQSPFVVESSSARTSRDRKTRSYRCERMFNELYRWLREHGANSGHPLHELRKEVGSIIANETGIFEASRYLRHSDIRITSQFYTDKKKRITPGLGRLIRT